MELLKAYCQEIDETVVVDYHFEFVKEYQTNGTARYSVMYGTLKIGEFGIYSREDDVYIYADNIAAHIPSFPHKFLATENTRDAAERVVQYYQRFVRDIIHPILSVHGVDCEN
nr:hypothetical protein K-LCC10_0141 [Kaumoebavirus]